VETAWAAGIKLIHSGGPVKKTSPVIDPTAFVAPGAMVRGDVVIGRDSSVWFGAVVRADQEMIRIGEETNIQDNCVLHSDPGLALQIGNRVTVGHGAVVHGAVVEDDVLIGIHASVLNGAHIGAGSVIGAGAVVGEGADIPPDSLVFGVPGKVVGKVPVTLHSRNRRTAASYVRLKDKYKEEGDRGLKDDDRRLKTDAG
jgi:carbonic anhydrase/acetyltransferase-like protein (isoleucine patch superfamily)